MHSKFEVTNVTKQVPVFTTSIEYEGLADLIKDHRRQYPEGYRSNVRAWRSDWFTHKKDIRFQPFVDVCLQACHFLCKDFRFINLHPALPNGPKGTWTDVVKNLIIL